MHNYGVKLWSIVYSKNLKVENNKIIIFNNKSNKNIIFPKYTFTVGERGNPHSPDSFLHVDKNECTSNLQLSWHLHFEAHTEQHLQAEHGQIFRSHPSHEEVWDIDMFSSPRVSKIIFKIWLYEHADYEKLRQNLFNVNWDSLFLTDDI